MHGGHSEHLDEWFSQVINKLCLFANCYRLMQNEYCPECFKCKCFRPQVQSVSPKDLKITLVYKWWSWSLQKFSCRNCMQLWISFCVFISLKKQINIWTDWKVQTFSQFWDRVRLIDIAKLNYLRNSLLPCISGQPENPNDFLSQITLISIHKCKLNHFAQSEQHIQTQYALEPLITINFQMNQWLLTQKPQIINAITLSMLSWSL